jgi:hypothetical protein
MSTTALSLPWAGSAAVVASGAALVVAVPTASGSRDPNKRVLDLKSALRAAYSHTTPITPAEYLAEMEAHGWRPLVTVLHGKPLRGISEWTVNEFPEQEDMEFLRYINSRVAKSGADFYERAGDYLIEQGRVAYGTEREVVRGAGQAGSERL